MGCFERVALQTRQHVAGSKGYKTNTMTQNKFQTMAEVA